MKFVCVYHDGEWGYNTFVYPSPVGSCLRIRITLLRFHPNHSCAVPTSYCTCSCSNSFTLIVSKPATTNMPLQRLTMSYDYAQRPINPLPQKLNRNPPRAIRISSTRAAANSVIQPTSIFPKSSTAITHRLQPVGNVFQRQLGGYGHFNPELKPSLKTRKFGEFAAGEDVTMGRATVSTLTNQAHQPYLESANNHVTALDYLAPVQLAPVLQSSINPVLPSVGQPTTQNSEEPGTSSKLQHHAPLSRPESLSIPFQTPENPESNAPVGDWRHVFLTTCVVGVAAVAVATGYACSTVLRGALNVAQFFYANRENIQQSCTTCTQAVQSTYNAAKRRMVSVRVPSQSHRRHAPSPTSQRRSRQRRYFWQRNRRERSSQSPEPAASTVSPEGMEGIEYSLPPSPVVSDSHFHLSTSHDLPSDVPRMTGAIPQEPTPSSCAPSLDQDQPATSPLSGVSTSVVMEPAEERIISYEESVFSDDLDDDDVVSVRGGKEVNGVAELFSKDIGQSHSTCLELERDWSLQNRFASRASFAETRPTEPLRQGNSPHVAFYESPRTGRPVDRSKKYVKDEPIDFPVDDSTFNASTMIEPLESPTQKEQDTESPQTHRPFRNRSPSPEGLTTPFLALTVSGRKGSMRANDIKRRAAKLRQEKEAAEAAERARLATEEAARKEKEEEEERLKRGYRRIPKGRIIQPLDPKWEQSVQNAMATPGMQEVLATTSSGIKLTRRDLGTLKVVKGRDPSHGWLNDEIISACLQQVVEYGLQASDHKTGETPKYYAFNTFFYKNLREKGAQSVKRWATKGKIGKENLLKVERVFIPVHSGAHWTLLVVSPIARTIEYFDSLGGPARQYILHAKAWLREELGKLFKEEEWTVPTGSLGAGPQQSNSSDCGVFTCTNARMVVLGVDPIAYAGSDMELQRTRMVAELLNGGLTGDFEPRVVF